MRRLMSLFLAIIMILGATQEVFAMNLIENRPEKPIEYRNIGGGGSGSPTTNDDFSFENIMPISIAPSDEERHEYRFYGSEEEASAAQRGDTSKNPFDIKYLRTDGVLEDIELVEQKDELFEGWFYMEDGEEKKVPFGKQGWIGENKTLYAYPKRSKVIAVFFSHGSVVHKSVFPDADGKVSINDQPGVGEAGKVLKGWSIDKSFNTAAEAEAEGKLFRFKEEANSTVVDGTLMLHAIFEDAIRVTFDTHSSKVIPGENIEAGERVKVPDSKGIEKEGYKFQYWYVLEDDENSPNVKKEVKLGTEDVDGVTYFNYKFTKNTIIHAKWQGEEVPFHIVFMAEKRPDQIVPGGEKYAFLGSFNNENDTTKQKTKGIAGSQIIFDDDNVSSPEKVTSLDKDQFKSYLEESNNANNLLKYADLMGITNKDLLKGFHVNKDKTNMENPIIEGNGLTTKVVYLDRDTVNLRVFKGGRFVDDETTSPDALGGFKYGQILLEKNENRGWNYLFKTYIKVGNKWRWLGNYEPKSTRSYFSIPPFAVESVSKGNKTAPYMKRNDDNTAWIFEFHDSPTYVEEYGTGYGNYTILSLPLRLPIDKQDLTYDQAKDWIKTGDVENLKNHLLPNKDNPLIGRMGGMPSWMYLEPVDYPLSDGYETINTTIPEADSQQEPPYGRPDGCTPSLKDVESIKKLKEVAGITDNGNYLVMPIIYKKQNFDLQFESKAKGDLVSKIIKDIPYNCTIVNPENPVDGDPNSDEKERKVKAYLDKFIPAIIDPDTKEVTNFSDVTKNQDGRLFMGWYLDPGYTIPFNEQMPMPAHNLQVFAKWEPLYHYITVHHLPAGTNGVNKPENITKIKVAHGELIDTEEDILKNPPILEGRSRADFQGWETYGDVIKEEPSVSGVDGGPFLYEFDKPVEKGFHLYPRWFSNKVGVVYAFNYDESDRPLAESEEIDKIMENLDNSDKPLIKKDRYYMSKYKYPLDSKVRLRAPFGWDDQGKILEPVAPEGTKAHGKVFLGWKIRYRDKLAPFAWHTVDNLVYYNSEIEFTENNISHKSGGKKGDAIGVMVLVAQWGEKKINTKLTLHRNHNDIDSSTKEYKIEDLNKEWKLPDLEKDTDLTKFGLEDFKRDKYQFLGWNENPDGSGKLYKPGEDIYIDETHSTNLNHLYAQWEKYYILEAEKEWKPKDKNNYEFKMGLLRYTAPSASDDPDFTGETHYKPVIGSLKNYKTDLEQDGKMKWEVPGLDKNGNRYSYVIVEVTKNMESAFKNFAAWGDLNVDINIKLKSKTQIIELTDGNSKIDIFTSATVRNDKIENGKTIGYDFVLTNEKIEVPIPVITQPYADEKKIVITPGKDIGNQVEKIEVTLPNGIVLELAKDTDGHFTSSNNVAYEVTADPTGKLTITLPENQALIKDKVITAVAKNDKGVPSKINTKTVLDAQDSVSTEKPKQNVRNENGDVVIESKIPQGSNPDNETIYTLVDKDENLILGKDGQPITARPDKDGKLTFKVPDGILTDGQNVKVKTEEPGKKPKLSELSDPLDLIGPEITVSDITGKVGVVIEEAIIGTNEAADITVSPNLPNSLVLGNANQTKTEWKINGKGEYVTTTTHKVVAVDKFGNKTEAKFTVIITNKDAVDQPQIDTIRQGDSSVKITPPEKGDRLVVTFQNGEVKLEKQADGSWKDPETNEVYEVVDGKIEVKIPNGEKLKVGDIVTAQGKDSTGTLADSSKVNKSVSPYDGSKPSSIPIYRKTGQTKVTDEQVKENLNYNDKEWKLDSISVPNYDRNTPGTSFAIAIFTSLKDGSTIVVPVDIIVTGEPIGPSVIEKVVYKDCPKSETQQSPKKEDEKPISSQDIKENKPYIIGDLDNTFRPEAGITRGEVATIFARLKNNMENMTLEGHDTKYPDVLKSDWYSGYIHFLSTYDIMKGYPDGTYRPKQVITRAEFAAIIARYMGLEPSDAHFADAVGNWAAGYIGAAHRAGYITGYPDGNYKPKKPISRAEAVTIINRMIKRRADVNYINRNHDKLRFYTDVPRNHWAYGDIYAASIHHWYRDGLKTDQWIETEYNRKK